MTISSFTIRLLLLFFPGIICSYLCDTFTIHKEKTPFKYFIQCFAFGLISYFLFWHFLPVYNFLIHYLGGDLIVEVTFVRSLLDESKTINLLEIYWASIYSIVLGVFLILVINYKIHFKILHLLRISTKFGELDVWGYIFNLKEVNWVTVRDIKNDLVYDGWVQAFSDDSNNAELLLRDVSVYNNSSGNPLYQIGMMYLSRKREDISIEVRTVNIKESIKWTEKTVTDKKEEVNVKAESKQTIITA